MPKPYLPNPHQRFGVGWVGIYIIYPPHTRLTQTKLSHTTPMIPKEKIELIKNTAYDQIVDIIGEYVELIKRGSTYVGLSPFSNERTPSFTVHPAKGIFKCFSSGNGGDLIKFIMLQHSIKFIEAVKFLAQKFNIDIDDNNSIFTYQPNVRAKPVEIQPDLIHPDEVRKTFQGYSKNGLFNYLVNRFPSSNIEQAFNNYYVGIDRQSDWVIFWQADLNHFVRSGKYIKYKSDGHRCKDTKAFWEHSRYQNQKPIYPDYQLVQCFFGEHLILEDVKKPIAIVESEKTAIIASLFMTNYYWLACGSKNGLNDVKCRVLANRSVTLFPDLGCLTEWTEQANKYGFSVNPILEKYATEQDRAKGLDLADYLLRTE